MLNRRSFLMNVPTIVSQKPNMVVAMPTVAQEKQKSGTVYVYETDRFRSMYTVLDHEKSLTVRQRVDWYDPMTDKPRSFNSSMVYITDFEEN